MFSPNHFACLSVSSSLCFSPFCSAEAVYKSSCCLTVHAISHYSPDVLKGHAGVALPLAFLGMHQQPDEQGDGSDANLWAEVWQDHVPGKGGSGEREA